MSYRTITVTHKPTNSTYVFREAIGLDEMSTLQINAELFPNEPVIPRNHVLGTYYYSRIVAQLERQDVGKGGYKLLSPNDTGQHDAYERLVTTPAYAKLFGTMSEAIDKLILLDPDPDLAPPDEGNAKNGQGPTSEKNETSGGGH